MSLWIKESALRERLIKFVQTALIFFLWTIPLATILSFK